jgi:hypothetical protein
MALNATRSAKVPVVLRQFLALVARVRTNSFKQIKARLDDIPTLCAGHKETIESSGCEVASNLMYCSIQVKEISENPFKIKSFRQNLPTNMPIFASMRTV